MKVIKLKKKINVIAVIIYLNVSFYSFVVYLTLKNKSDGNNKVKKYCHHYEMPLCCKCVSKSDNSSAVLKPNAWKELNS